MPAYLWFLWSVAVYCAVVVLVAKSLQRRSDRERGALLAEIDRARARRDGEDDGA